MATTLTPLETNSATLAKTIYLLDSTDLRVFPGEVKQDLKDVKAVLTNAIKVLDETNDARKEKERVAAERKAAREAKASTATAKTAPKAATTAKVTTPAPKRLVKPRAKKAAAPAATEG